MISIKSALFGSVGLLSAFASCNAGTVIATESAASGHKYEVVVDSVSSWDQAAADASAKGGYLVTIGNATEQAFVEKLLTTSGAPSGSYWQGLSEAGEGNYVYVSGVTPKYTNWLPGQPDNSGGVEDRGSILWFKGTSGNGAVARKGLWNDLPNAGGYPQVASVYPDLVSAGYVVEFHGTNPTFNNGDGDNLIGGASAVPLPSSLVLAPAGLLVAGFAAMRMRKNAMA